MFSLDPKTCKEKVLYLFCPQQNCTGGLIDAKGSLYGTTIQRGAHGGGTVFALDEATGVETVLYSFCAQEKCADGKAPLGSLLDVKGTLYGATDNGGNDAYCANAGCGTVFAIKP